MYSPGAYRCRKPLLDVVGLRLREISERRHETGLLEQLACGAVGVRLAVLDLTRTDVPEAVAHAMEDEELITPVDEDRGLAVLPRQAWTFL